MFLSKMNPWKRLFVTASISLITLYAQPGSTNQIDPATIDNGKCIQDAANTSPYNLGDLVCTASDVSIARATNVQLIENDCAVDGSGTVRFSTDFEVVSSATRYNVGIYFSVDNDSNNDGALTGACSVSTLPTTLELDSPPNSCGDITNGSPVIRNITLTVPCSSVDANWNLRLPYCTAWNNTPGGVCASPADAVPGTKSKCKCESGSNFQIVLPGAIKVTKTTYSGDSSAFPFQLKGPDGYDQTISATANTDIPADFNKLAPGSYHLVENIPAGWNLVSATCNDGSANIPQNADGSFDITVVRGKVVTCSFVDDNRAHIRVSNVTLPNTDANSFEFTTTGDGYNGFTLSNGQTNDQVLAAGIYSVEAAANANYVTTASCFDGETAIDPTNISLLAAHTVDCTFTNVMNGSIIVEERTSPAGGSESYSFTGAAEGSISDGQQIIVNGLAPGVYTSVEADTSLDYVLSNITCDDGSSLTPSNGDKTTRTATFNLDPGETVKCVFTNSQKVAAIAITASSDTTSITAPSTITYSYLVTNVGDRTLTGIALSDDNDNDDLACPSATLLVGESMTCSATHTVTQAELDKNGSPTIGSGVVLSNATASSNETSPATAQLSIPIVQDLALFIVNVLESNADEDLSSSVTLGDTLTYNYTVTNIGNTTLTNVVLTDNVVLAANIVCSPSQPASLLPSETMNCSGTYVVTAADVSAGSISSTSTAVSNEGVPVSNVLLIAVNNKCGDGVLGTLEQCDDGNTVSGDGCSATCATEQAPATEGTHTTSSGGSHSSSSAAASSSSEAPATPAAPAPTSTGPTPSGAGDTNGGGLQASDPGCSCDARGTPGSNSNWMLMGMLLSISMLWRGRRRQERR